MKDVVEKKDCKHESGEPFGVAMTLVQTLLVVVTAVKCNKCGEVLHRFNNYNLEQVGLKMLPINIPNNIKGFRT